MEWLFGPPPSLAERTPEEMDLPMSGTVEGLLRELAEMGILTDAATYRAEAQRLKGSREIALEWARRNPSGPRYRVLVAYSIMLWARLLPDAPDAGNLIACIAQLAFDEPVGWDLGWVLTTKRRVVQLATFAYDIQPEAPGEWLEKAMDWTGPFDLLGFVLRFLQRLCHHGEANHLAEIARAWCPLLIGLDSRVGRLCCWCGSGRKMRRCCARVGRG